LFSLVQGVFEIIAVEKGTLRLVSSLSLPSTGLVRLFLASTNYISLSGAALVGPSRLSSFTYRRFNRANCALAAMQVVDLVACNGKLQWNIAMQGLALIAEIVVSFVGQPWELKKEFLSFSEELPISLFLSFVLSMTARLFF
jgi:hypothetical protein